ncbi:MAG: TetR/AcrR family transcriptional regulator [Syntrophomonas sp.]
MASKRNKGKRELIIEAAIQEFSRKGYHNTRMEEIAVTAGIGKGTIYEYFDSKLHLFQSMMEDSLHVYYHELEIKNLEEKPISVRLKLLVKTHIRFCLENQELTKVLFGEAEAPDKELMEWAMAMRRDKLERMQKMLVEGIDKGEFRDDLDLKMLSFSILHTMAAFWFPLVMEDWQMDPELLASQYTEFVLTGLKKA